MDYNTIDGRMFEFTPVYLSEGDDVHVECFDMTAADGGAVGVLVVGPAGEGTLHLERAVGTNVLRAWLRIAERDAGLAASAAPHGESQDGADSQET